MNQNIQHAWERCKLSYRTFKILQLHGPLVTEHPVQEYTCKHCGRVFQGNFCPDCGQDAEVERFTWRNVFRNIVWSYFSMDHGFIRTMLELMYRPGYMIRDYLNGHRAPYFRPIQLLFVLATILLLFIQLVYGYVLEFANGHAFKDILNQWLSGSLPDNGGNHLDRELLERVRHGINVILSIHWPDAVVRIADLVYGWVTGNLAITILLALPFFYLALRRQFRKNPIGRSMNGPECLLAMVYMCCHLLILTLILNFVALVFRPVFSIIGVIFWLYWAYDLHQLYQLSYRRSLLVTIVLFLRIWFYMWLVAAVIGAIAFHLIMLL